MTEICENNKMHYFYREMDFRKTEWPSLQQAHSPPSTLILLDQSQARKGACFAF